VSAAVSDVLERTNDIITNPLSPPLWVPLPKYRRFKKSLAVLNEFVYATIAEKRVQGREERVQGSGVGGQGEDKEDTPLSTSSLNPDPRTLNPSFPQPRTLNPTSSPCSWTPATPTAARA